MPKMTVSIPDELFAKIKESNPHINLAEVVRRGIINKIKELEKCGLIPSGE